MPPHHHSPESHLVLRLISLTLCRETAGLISSSSVSQPCRDTVRCRLHVRCTSTPLHFAQIRTTKQIVRASDAVPRDEILKHARENRLTRVAKSGPIASAHTENSVAGTAIQLERWERLLRIANNDEIGSLGLQQLPHHLILKQKLHFPTPRAAPLVHPTSGRSPQRLATLAQLIKRTRTHVPLSKPRESRCRSRQHLEPATQDTVTAD